MRKDLINRFENTVKQEIKNHNDSVLAYNQRCNYFDKRLSVLENTLTDIVSDLKQSIGHVKDRIDHLNGFSTDHSHKNRCLEHNLNKKSVENKLDIERIDNELDRLHVMSDQYFGSLDILFKRVEKIECDRLIMAKEIFSNMGAISKEFHELIAKTEKKILDKPCSKEGHIRILEQENKFQTVTMHGIQGEIELIKEKKFYQDKKIEQLMMDVEKLQGAK